jgi:aminopeptidase N
MKVPGRASPSCDVLTEEKQVVKIPGACAPWVFVNAGADGYYRTAYSPDTLRVMAPRIGTDLSAPERLSLLDDEWALMRAGRHSAGDYLTLASELGREHTSGVLEEVANRLSFLHDYMTTGEARARYQTFVRGLFRPLYDEIGFTGPSSESDDRRSLRAAVVAALGTIGRDPDVVAKSRSAVDRALSGATPIEPTLAGAVVKTAAIHGDAALFDALLGAAERASDPDEHYRYLYALADFRAPALVDRGLQLALTPQLRSQDTAIYLGRFFSNPDARDRALSFLTEHWDALESKIVIAGGDTNLVRSMSTFCDTRSRERIASLFSEHKLPGAVRTLDQTLEQIDNCIALREEQAPVVQAWLARR